MMIKGKYGTYVTQEEYNKSFKTDGQCVDEILQDMLIEMRSSTGQEIRVNHNNFKIAQSLARCIAMDMSIKEHLRFIYKKLIYKIRTWRYIQRISHWLD